MHRKNLANTCNYLGYVILLLGIIVSIYIFDLNLILERKEYSDLAKYSIESEYLSTVVDSKEDMIFRNIFMTIVAFITSLVVSINLWYKANILNSSEVETVEVEAEIEETEESNEEMQHL